MRSRREKMFSENRRGSIIKTQRSMNIQGAHREGLGKVGT